MTMIAFLGLGAMGSRMALRLLDAGHASKVWNRSAAAAEPLIAKGAIHAATPRAAAESAEIVIAMLSDDEAARSVWLNTRTGAIRGLSKGAIAMECSTVTPDWIAELATAADAKSVTLLDAPVAGSRPQAEAGQLIFLAGGPDHAMKRAAPIMKAMGQTIHHLGPTGHGARMKLAVNAMLGGQMALVAEVSAFLKKSGLDFANASAIMQQMPVTSPAAAIAFRLMVAGNHDPLFPVSLMAKDLSYVLKEALPTKTGMR
jgi:3-hydroxyisobutyrate dehydrogenase-like beta-hydroxyacid dehydrogenase